MKASQIAVCAVVMLVLVEAQLSMAVTCSVTELSSCAGAFSSSAKPPKACCTKLAEQKPCFCNYLRNPVLRNYVNSPNAQKVASTCGVSIPKC